MIWNGSLNSLSYSGQTGEIMDRIENETYCKEVKKVMEIESLVHAMDDPEERICPICGSEMLIANSDEGGYYWKCVNKDYTRNSRQPYPKDGVFRCRKCGEELAFSMKNQPRWVCTQCKGSYQLMGAGDLKLGRMRSRIPEGELPRVLAYFETRKKQN